MNTNQNEENTPGSNPVTTTSAESEAAIEAAAAMDMDIKAQKFREIANRRANEACKKISLVGNLDTFVGPYIHCNPFL